MKFAPGYNSNHFLCKKNKYLYCRPGSVDCEYILKYLKSYLELFYEEVQEFIQSEAFRKLENKIMTSLNNGKISKDHLEAEKTVLQSGIYFLIDRLPGNFVGFQKFH